MWRLWCSLVICGLLAPAVVAAEAEPWGVSLLARDSLAGWDAGPELPRGWTIKDGVLRGDSNSTPLVSAWTFGDYEMKYSWKGSPGAMLFIDWLDVPGGKVVWPHGRESLPEGSSFRVKRVGDTYADFKGDSDTPFGIGSENAVKYDRLALRLSIRGGSGEITSLRIKEPAGKPMFNGQDLAGWWTPGNLASWPVIDGHVVCVNQKGDYLRSEKEYGNFTLSLEYKMAAGGNSGVGIRTPRLAWPSTEGMELQMLDEIAGQPITRNSTMSIYGNIGPLARADRSEQWNHAVIRAEGYMISAWMNGELVQQVNTFWKPELKHRFLSGWIGLQDHGARTEFRNVRVLEAPAGLGLDSWNAPRRQHGSEIVVDRLMNAAELSRQGTSAVVPDLAADDRNDPKETTLAEMTGPGAVVAMTVHPKQTRVRFYFDGATRPAVDCRVAELPEHVPVLTQDESPLLVYVPFRKSLKITAARSLADPSDASNPVTIEYLPLAADTIVEPFAGPTETAVRGLLPALSYRWQQHGHGGLRQFDRLLKQTSDPQVAAPNERVELLKVEGTGIVRWFRLRCPTKALQNDDLWLEITTDNEQRPSIAAPVRYFFPGLDQGKNYQNLVVLSRNGFVNRLAMPYTQGISFAVVNRGRRTVKDLELTAAYDASYRVEEGSRYPLRGLFQSDAQKLDILFLTPVRLMGIVCSDRPNQPHSPIEAFFATGSERWTYPLLSRDDLLGLAPGATEVRQTLNGRSGGLAWRWWLLGPPELCAMSERDSGTFGDRLILYYGPPRPEATTAAPAK